MNKNRILSPAARKSENFFKSDNILQHFLKKHCSTQGFEYMHSKLNNLGKSLAEKVDHLSQLADKNPPILKKRNALGEDINEIEFHPAYQNLIEIAVESEMLRVKWQPGLRKQFSTERHTLGFGAGYLFAMGESGLFCPLCMTDGVAYIIDRFGTTAQKEKFLPKIATNKADELFTGAMFLTEKAGGSDVGANLVEAKAIGDDYYQLNGEKWFCSNANAELILVLARTNPEIAGTKGLSIFLIEQQQSDGSLNHKNIVRLKDKLGVRSMASAEIILENTLGKIIGKEGQGFPIMAEMINLSRLYNSVAASAVSRRALIEAYQYLSFRKTFGKIALDHPLVLDKLAELAAIHIANFYFTWHTILMLDKAENGNEKALQLLRLLTPMLKKSTAEDSVYVCREAMEAIGGIAYIEESIIPKLLRDALVLPIWEGAGNIMVLDMMRAAFRANALLILFEELQQILNTANDEFLLLQLEELFNKTDYLRNLPQHEQEVAAKYFFDKLTKLYRVALLYLYKDKKSERWIEPAIVYLKKLYFDSDNENLVNERKQVEEMIAWEF